MKKFLLAILLMALAWGASLSAQRRSVSILGDSYSTFEGFVRPDNNLVWYFADSDTARTDVSSVRDTWWHRFVRDNNLRLEQNNSYSGSTICNTGYDKADYSDRSFVTRMKNLGSPDMIIIFGATNDSWAGAPIGEYKYGGWTAEDLNAFRPAMACMLATMKDYYPGTDIYFVLNCILSEDINDSVHEICRHYGVPVVDLEGIDCRHGHPTRKGMNQIAEQVKAVVFK